MSKYIKIANESGFVSRIALEKLGLSTKRNDPDTIGQFGSGIKYAPIAALRMGLDWAFTGEDEKGPYTLKYDVENEDGVDCIVYNYGDYKKSSSFTVDAGVLSWEDPFQIYREAIANAMDEAYTSNGNWYRSIVEEKDVAYNKGEFAVYITASPLMMEIYNDHNKYFLENRDSVYENESSYAPVKFYKPYNKQMHVYSKQVMVYENEEWQPMFDYEIQNLKLNEMRTVSDEFSMNYRIAQSICECKSLSIAKDMIKMANSGKTYFEFELSTSLHDVDDNWLEAWCELYDDNCIMVTDEQSLNQAYVSFIKEKGFPFKTMGSSFFFGILKKAGVRTIDDIAGEAINFEIDTDINRYPKLVKAIEIAARFEPGLLQLEKPIACFLPKQKDHYLGVVINPNTDDKQILIDRNHALNGELNEIVATVIHEYDHYETGYTDGDIAGRSFRDLADRRIGKMMCEFYRPELIQVGKDGIYIPIESVSELGGIQYNIEWSRPLECYIMSIGKRAYKIYSHGLDTGIGCAIAIDNGTRFFIEIPEEFTISVIH
jgi:hypothetical protein